MNRNVWNTETFEPLLDPVEMKLVSSREGYSIGPLGEIAVATLASGMNRLSDHRPDGEVSSYHNVVV